MIKHDMKRVLSGWDFPLAVGLVVLIMALTTAEQQDWNRCIVDIVENIFYRVESLLILAFATLPYAVSLIDDFAHKSVYQVLSRCDIRKYIASKTLCIFMSSVAVTMAGIVLYVIILRVSGHEWVDPQIVECYEINVIGLPDLEMWFLFDKNLGMLFYVLMGIQYGLLAGITSLCAVYLSLFVKNKMMIMVVPVLMDYVIMTYLDGVIGYEWMNVNHLFNAYDNYTFWGNNFFARCLLIGFVCYIVLTVMIYYRVRRRLRYD